MVRVLVADSNLEAHELIQDIVHINFRNVKVERAHNCESFISKVEAAKPPYNLILFSFDMDEGCGEKTLTDMIEKNPEIGKRTILMAESKAVPVPEAFNDLPTVTKPYSLDYFGEVIKKTCAN